MIHSYSPTDASHSFTIEVPYMNDVIVAGQPTDQTLIHNATITIAANQAGMFASQYKFHTPQMAGTILVQVQKTERVLSR